MSACRVCRCTEQDCRGCIARTGEPCSWVEPDLCSACSPGVDLRRQLDEMVERGETSPGEADEAHAFFDELSDRQIRGEVTEAEALRRVVEFAALQLARRMAP